MMCRTQVGAGLWAAAAALVLSVCLSAMGCTTERHTRNVEFTHWHDEDTLIVVYTRQQTAGTATGIIRSEPRTTHIRVCTVQEDNSLKCKHQREVVNMLNPHLVNSVDLDDRWRR